MHLEGTGKRLSIFCGESDRYRHHSLANAIVGLVMRMRHHGHAYRRAIAREREGRKNRPRKTAGGAASGFVAS